MEMLQIIGVGLIATVLILILKEQKPLFAFLLAAFAGMFMFLMLIGKIAAIVAALQGLALKAGVDAMFLKTVLKIIGIAYIAEFGAQIVRDAGLESIASKIELSAKILIMALAIPILTVIVETVIKLIPA